MKIPFFFGCFLGCAAVLILNAAAAGYTDDMSGADGNDFKSYSNLTPQSYRGAAALPDSTALSFADISKPIGSAVYLVSGAETVKAAIYTHVGTLVTQRPEDGQYMLGVFQQNVAETMTNGPLQALYCPRTGGVYTEAGGLKQAARDMLLSYRFVPVIAPPQGEMIGYGVNVYYSADGGQFTRAPVTDFSYKYDLTAQFCYEEYSAAVPQSARMIKVEINDAYDVPLIGGGSFQKLPRYMTALASVALSGGRLSLGVQEPSLEPPSSMEVPVENSLSGWDDEDGEAYASQKSAPKGKGKENGEEETEAGQEFLDAAKKGTSSKSESSSKFSGTITSSSKERAPSSERPSSNSAGKSAGRESSSAPSEPSEAREESVIYQISRNPEGTRFNGAVTAYIIAVSAAILLVAVLPRKK